MLKLAALFVAVVGAVYMDLDAGDALRSLVFPALLVIGLVYLLRPVGFLIATAGVACFRLSDLTSDSLVDALLFPALFLASLIAFCAWAWKIGALQELRCTEPGIGGVGGDAGGGGDGGGC